MNSYRLVIKHHSKNPTTWVTKEYSGDFLNEILEKLENIHKFQSISFILGDKSKLFLTKGIIDHCSFTLEEVYKNQVLALKLKKAARKL